MELSPTALRSSVHRHRDNSRAENKHRSYTGQGTLQLVSQESETKGSGQSIKHSTSKTLTAQKRANYLLKKTSGERLIPTPLTAEIPGCLCSSSPQLSGSTITRTAGRLLLWQTGNRVRIDLHS